MINSARLVLLVASTLVSFSYSNNSYGTSYAAIAYSMGSRHYGIGQSEIEMRDAYHKAMEACGGSGCFVRAGVVNGCIAFARDQHWDGIGFSGNASLAQAKRKALSLCYRPWNNLCRIEYSFCSRSPQ